MESLDARSRFRAWLLQQGGLRKQVITNGRKGYTVA